MSFGVCSFNATQMTPADLTADCRADCNNQSWGSLENLFWFGMLEIGISTGVKILPYLVGKTADFVKKTWMPEKTINKDVQKIATSFAIASKEVSQHVQAVGTTLFIVGAGQKFFRPGLIDTTCVSLCAKTTERWLQYKA
jgi:hypothetical protein